MDGGGWMEMERLAQDLPLLLGAALAGLVLLCLRQTVGRCIRLAGRAGAGLAFLALWDQVGSALGAGLGVNLFNALVLGVLGVPGFGLLLLLDWAVR